jgi:hypothetical protein
MLSQVNSVLREIKLVERYLCAIYIELMDAITMEVKEEAIFFIYLRIKSESNLCSTHKHRVFTLLICKIQYQIVLNIGKESVSQLCFMMIQGKILYLEVLISENIGIDSALI